MIKQLFWAVLAALAVTGCKQPNEQLLSPDGNLLLEFGIDNGRPFYTLARGNKLVVDTSYVGIEMADCALGIKSSINGVSRQSHDETWQQVWGEETNVRNNYNELKVSLTEAGQKVLNYSIVFRLFDDGAGFRYEIPEQGDMDSIVIIDERTQFNMASDARAWFAPWDYEFYEALYMPSPVSELDTVSTPLTMEMNDSLYVTIHQAALTDYAFMNLENVGETRLQSYLSPWSTGEKVFARLPLTTPWRTIIVGRTPGDLMLSRLMLNLNEPCAIENTDWIEPGRYIGIWWSLHRRDETWNMGPNHGATTENAKKYIDFAAKYGYQGVLAEGWNKSWGGDYGLKESEVSFTEAYPDFDIAEVAAYAREKGVSLITHWETYGCASNLEAQLDSALALCERLGIHAAKTGYAGKPFDGKELHSSQYAIRHYRKVIEEAAKHQVMIDNHEPIMPTGLQRTYPNLMTQEGVRGQEYNAWSTDGGTLPMHTVTIPFTRGLAGPMDYTPGILKLENEKRPGIRPQTTIAKEIALAVVLYSPLQMSADMIENYEGNPAFEFLKSTPATWSKTVVPEAKIGEYVTVARRDRDSDDWYVGAITGERNRDTELSLDFLEPGAKYRAKIFADGPGADYAVNPYPLTVTEQEVDSKTVLPLHLANGGGAAVIVKKL